MTSAVSNLMVSLSNGIKMGGMPPLSPLRVVCPSAPPISSVPPSSPVTQSSPHLVDLHYRVSCPDCQDPDPQVIEDFAQGDLICARCGVVLGDRIIDTRSEWRTFSHDHENDQSRVGNPVNPLLGSSLALDTLISRRDGGSGMAKDLSRMHGREMITSSDRQIIKAFKQIGTLCERLDIPQTITDRARHLYKKAEKMSMGAGRRNNEAVIAACLYIACRQENVPRSFKEICALTRVPKRDIGRCYKMLVRELEERMSSVSTEDFMSRFCSNLNLPLEIKKAATALTNRAKEIGCVAGKSPTSIAAAGIYMIAQLSGGKYHRCQKDIAAVAGVSEITIRNAYRDLYRYRYEVVPKDYAIVGSIDDLPRL